jgi:hypothetical protein
VGSIYRNKRQKVKKPGKEVIAPSGENYLFISTSMNNPLTEYDVHKK